MLGNIIERDVFFFIFFPVFHSKKGIVFAPGVQRSTAGRSAGAPLTQSRGPRRVYLRVRRLRADAATGARQRCRLHLRGFCDRRVHSAATGEMLGLVACDGDFLVYRDAFGR